MLKFSILAVLLIVASLFMFISLSEGADWRYYGSYTLRNQIDQDCYYDADSVKYLPNNIVRFWEKCEYRSNPGMGNLFTRLLMEIDCYNSTVKALEYYAFERSGEIGVSDKEPGKWSNIIPGTGPDSLLKILCKRK